MKASYLNASVEIQAGKPVNMMDMATSTYTKWKGTVHEIFNWDLTVCVYNDWHEELRTIERYSCQ